MTCLKRPRGRFSEDYPADRRCVRLSEWPEADRLAYERARRPGDVFELPGPAAGWAEGTHRSRKQAYGRYLTFLKLNNLLLPSEGPADRVTPSRLRLYLPQMRTRLSAVTAAQSVFELSLMLMAMVPDRDWHWIRRQPGVPSVREVRESRRVKKTFNPLALCSQALDLLDHITTSPYTSDSHLQYRNALIVACQCTFALRRRNLINMVLGRNLVIADGVIHIAFQSHETKTHAPIRCTMPAFLVPYMLRYLNEVRPVLLKGRVSDAVWIGSRHEALQDEGCTYLFTQIGIRLLGHPIACHTFRHSAATNILTRNPRDIRIASGVLTHDSLRTVNLHYDLSGEEGSRRVWNKLRRDIIRGGGDP